MTGYNQVYPQSQYPGVLGITSLLSEHRQNTTNYTQDTRGSQTSGTYEASILRMSPTESTQNALVYDASNWQSSSQQHASMPGPAATTSYFTNDQTNPVAEPAFEDQAVSILQPSAHQGLEENVGHEISHNPTSSSAAGTTAQKPEHTAFKDYEEAYTWYQSTLGNVMQNILSSSLEIASENLLTMSDWLLSNVKNLGDSMASDPKTLKLPLSSICMLI